MKKRQPGGDRPFLKKILALLLLASLTLGAAACGGETGAPAAQTAAAPDGDTAVTEAETEDPNSRAGAKDGIPDGVDFGGTEVNIVYRNEEWYEHWDVLGTDNSGDVVWDAIRQRNNNVEERFNVRLNIQPTSAIGLSNVAAEIKTFVLAGSTDYDIIVSTGNTTVTQSLYPYLYELSGLRYLDIGAPWWRTDAIEAMSLDGKSFRFLMGDNTINDYLKCGVAYYNKQIYADIGGSADELYTEVLDGKWTWDRMREISGTAYIDRNGDGAVNQGDQFGLMWTGTEGLTHMVMSCDPVLYTRADDGTVDLSVINNERNANIIDKLIAVLKESDGVWLSDQGIDASPEYFAQDYSLFYIGRLSNAVSANMREMQHDYGILPLPKYDESQSGYVTNIQSSATVTCVMKTVPDDRIEMVGAVIEGWASEAYRTVITPFIETALKLKYSRDDYSSQVIDIVFDTAGLNFLEMYGGNTGDIYSSAFVNPISSGKNKFASSIAKNIEKAQKALDKYLDTVTNADG